MWQRREFLKHSVTVAALASTGALAKTAGALSVAGEFPIDVVLVDERYSDSRAFAEALVRRGAESFPISADLGRLWYGPLGERFARRNIRIAGLTSHADLHLAEGFAGERGGRVIYRGCHDCRGSDVLKHALDLRSATEFQSAGAAWPSALAATLTRDNNFNGRVAAITERAADHPGTLWSWLLINASPAA